MAPISDVSYLDGGFDAITISVQVTDLRSYVQLYPCGIDANQKIRPEPPEIQPSMHFAIARGRAQLLCCCLSKL